MSMQVFETRDALFEAACKLARDRLNAAVSEGGRASLLLSGGSTPAPMYELLSHEELDWSAIEVGLVDERWVEEDHPASNASLIRKSLLQNNASNAVFHVMKTPHETPVLAQQDVEDRYSKLFENDAVVVLGMGPDGHTASLFPNAEGLSKAMTANSTLHVAAINALGSDVSGSHTERMTLTLNAIAKARDVILLISGDEKRHVLEDEAKSLPIHSVCEAVSGKLTKMWAP